LIQTAEGKTTGFGMIPLNRSGYFT